MKNFTIQHCKANNNVFIDSADTVSIIVDNTKDTKTVGYTKDNDNFEVYEKDSTVFITNSSGKTVEIVYM